jgi:hypothetical protein
MMRTSESGHWIENSALGVRYGNPEQTGKLGSMRKAAKTAAEQVS